MPKAIKTEAPYTKQFKDEFNKLCWSRNRGVAWSDFVAISACSISNAVDSAMFEQREQMYLRIIQGYTKEEQDIFAQLFEITMLALEGNPEQDFLGDIYSTLELLNKNIGQVFTPYPVATMMAMSTCGNWAEHINEKGFISINDPCCGAGVMLVAVANVARKQGINYQKSMVFVGQDIDFTVAMMCYIQLSLLGCVGYVIVGNSLLLDPPSRENIWHLPMSFLRRNLMEKFLHQACDGGEG